MHTGAGSSHTFFCLWFFSSSLFPFPPGSDGDIRRLMTMFHTRGWGEQDNRLVSRLDLKHTQWLEEAGAEAAARMDAPGSAGLHRPRGHRRCFGTSRARSGMRSCNKPSSPKTQRVLPSSSAGEVPAPGGMPSQHRGAATSLLPSSLPGWGDAGDLHRWPRRPGRWPGAR